MLKSDMRALFPSFSLLAVQPPSLSPVSDQINPNFISIWSNYVHCGAIKVYL